MVLYVVATGHSMSQQSIPTPWHHCSCVTIIRHGSTSLRGYARLSPESINSKRNLLVFHLRLGLCQWVGFWDFFRIPWFWAQVKGFLHIFFSINSWTVGWLASTVSIYSWSTSRSFFLLDILINCTSQMCSLPYPPKNKATHIRMEMGWWFQLILAARQSFEKRSPLHLWFVGHTHMYIYVYILVYICI